MATSFDHGSAFRAVRKSGLISEASVLALLNSTNPWAKSGHGQNFYKAVLAPAFANAKGKPVTVKALVDLGLTVNKVESTRFCREGAPNSDRAQILFAVQAHLAYLYTWQVQGKGFLTVDAKPYVHVEGKPAPAKPTVAPVAPKAAPKAVAKGKGKTSKAA